MNTSTPERPGEWVGTLPLQAVRALREALPFRHSTANGPLVAPFRVRVAGDSDVQVASIRLDCPWTAESDAHPGYVMLWSTRGEATADMAGEVSMRLTPAPAMIPAGKAFTLHSGGGTVNLLFFATDRFESLAGNHLDIRIGPVRFTVNPRPEQVAALTHLLDRCGPVLMNPNTVEEIRADLNQQLIIATAVTFRATPERSIDGTEPFGVFARAQGSIEQNLHLALTVGQIASGVGVTERQLQIAFHRQGDTTPLAYVRQVRLYRVRRDLRDATPGIRIADVAARWGFTHYARFEAAFTREFNRLPVVGGQGQAVSTLLEN